MKKLQILSAFFALFLVASCTNNSSTDPQPSTSIAGTWRVSSYVDSGKDETSKFSGMTFEFKSGGVFTATTSTGTITNGTWSESTSSNKLIITITGTDALDDASDDWLIVSKHATHIHLRDDNVTSGEEIQFMKN